jgi:hypothetical protein
MSRVLAAIMRDPKTIPVHVNIRTSDWIITLFMHSPRRTWVKAHVALVALFVLQLCLEGTFKVGAFVARSTRTEHCIGLAFRTAGRCRPHGQPRNPIFVSSAPKTQLS